MMKRLVYNFLLPLMLLLLASQLSRAQKTAEFGLLLGRAYYLGEINPETHWGNGVGNFSYGAIFRYNLNDRYSLKLNLNRTELSGDDEAADLLFNLDRKAAFDTKLTELSGSIEFNFLPYKIGKRDRAFSPYLFTGFSYFWYNPSTTISGSPAIGSEGGRGRGLAFLFGPGLKLNIGRKMSLNLEWGFRKTPTDQLDGLPNRQFDLFESGKNYDNDWYVISAFMLTYKITKESACPMQNF